MNKLVRDSIPTIIAEAGRTCKWRRVYDVNEHTVYLKKKMAEEVNEFIENPSYEEAADMLEVLKSFCHVYNLQFPLVELDARIKERERGGFNQGIILLEVEK